MAISAADVMKLRNITNAPMMDCKAALTETSGDMDKAVEHLRKKNKDIQAKKGERETPGGGVATYVDDNKKVGAIIELRCESAPVAKTDGFIKLAEDLAKHVASQKPANVEQLLNQPFLGDAKKTVHDRIGELVGVIKENMKPARFARLEGLLGSYIHHDGTVGVLLQAEGAKADRQGLRDVCVHITGMNPMAVRREDVPADVVAKEKEIAMSQLAADPKNKNKPANIMEKIIEGKLKTWFAENVLVDQIY